MRRRGEYALIQRASRQGAGGPDKAGRSKYWLKVKNRKHPAMSRVIKGQKRLISVVAVGDA
jgi:hypothetical protein